MKFSSELSSNKAGWRKDDVTVNHYRIFFNSKGIHFIFKLNVGPAGLLSG